MEMVAKKRSGNYLRFLAYLVVVVLVNIVGITLFFRIDLTENRLYSISNVSRQVVSTLSEPLTINVFFTKNLPAPHNNTERYLHDLLEEYSIYANRYFNYRFYDVSPDEGDITEEARKNRELAQNYGIYPVQIQCVEKDEIKFQKAYMGLVVIHGDMIEKVPAITSTEGLEYKLTMAIQKLNNKISALLNLREKVRVKLFLSSSLERVAPAMRLSDLSELPGKLEAIVDKLNDKNYGKLEFKHLDPTSDKDLEAEVEKYNILSLRWPVLSGGKIPAGKGAIGLVMEHGTKAVTLPLIRVLRVPLIGTHYEPVDMNEMEEIMNESLESLIDINEDLGYLADHGTLNLWGAAGQQEQGSVGNFRKLTSQSYTIKDVNLKDDATPRGLNCLVIAGPTETFDDYALFQIDQFLMQGGNLAIFLDAFNEVMPPKQPGTQYPFNQRPMYIPLSTGLEKLLEHYGVRIKKSYVMDENCYRQKLSPQFGGGERAIYFAPLIKNRFINNELGFMKNIKELVALEVAPLALDTEHIEKIGLKAHTVLSSSEKSWEMSERINLNPLSLEPPPSPDEQQSFPLAYLLEGRFPSYFAGKPMPERKTAESSPEKTDSKKMSDKEAEVDLSKIEGGDNFLSRGRPGKIFVMASSGMLKDNMLDPEGRSPNAVFIMNVLDYLNNREGVAVMRSKEQRFNPLREARVGTKIFVKSFNIAGLPVLVVFFGLLVWLRRHSRKKYIETMFQK